MSSSNNAENMYQENVKATEPDKQGKQYNDGMVAPLSVTRDQYGNEITEDRTSHTNTTPGEGSWSFEQKHYSDDFMGGFGAPYGVTVTDNGQSPQVERASVDVSQASRGKEY